MHSAVTSGGSARVGEGVGGQGDGMSERAEQARGGERWLGVHGVGIDAGEHRSGAERGVPLDQARQGARAQQRGLPHRFHSTSVRRG